MLGFSADCAFAQGILMKMFALLRDLSFCSCLAFAPLRAFQFFCPSTRLYSFSVASTVRSQLNSSRIRRFSWIGLGL